MDEILNLDALAPKAVQIKFENQTVKVEPPTLEQYTVIIELSEAMKKAGADIGNMAPIYAKIKDLVGQVIPEFANKNLNFMQLTAIFKLLSELGAPTTDEAVAELARRGIKLNPEGNTSPKGSASPKPSVAS